MERHASGARVGMQPISVIAPYLPTQLHRKRDVAREKIGRIFADIIQKRRASGRKEKDILQAFIDGRYERVHGGRQLNESEIVGLLIAALYAGMHTSTITSAWTGIFLAAHPEAWAACVKEQREVVAAHGEDVTVETLGAMPVLHACITEALRMHPPLIMMLRYVHKAFTVKGACQPPLPLLFRRRPSACPSPPAIPFQGALLLCNRGRTYTRHGSLWAMQTRAGRSTTSQRATSAARRRRSSTACKASSRTPTATTTPASCPHAPKTRPPSSPSSASAAAATAAWAQTLRTSRSRRCAPLACLSSCRR
jgi:Cytochrome P450